MPYYLGADLGTTTVKVCLIDENKKVVIEAESPHNATVSAEAIGETSESKNFHEQNCRQIISTFFELINEHFFEKLSGLSNKTLHGIGVSGQMHGIVFWNSLSIQNWTETADWKCSNIITWMDQRCNQDFIDSLPKSVNCPNNYLMESPSSIVFRWKNFDGKIEGIISTGYGLATLAWLTKHQKLSKNWDCCGTIMDFFTTILTCSQHSFISTQNAYSWGYCYEKCWIVEEFGESIPTKLLPKIVEPGFVVGTTAARINFGIPLGATVMVGLGDLQASLLPFIEPNKAVLHVGTSAQIVIQAQKKNIGNHLSSQYPALCVIPFFGNEEKLIVAASLNGGNSFNIFAKQIAALSNILFGTDENLQLQPEIFENVLNDSSALQKRSSLRILPLFYGERHKPYQCFTIENWNANITSTQVLQEIARGTIRNLSEMMPTKLLQEFGIDGLYMINKATQLAYVTEATLVFPHLKLSMGDGIMSSAFGVALSLLPTK